MSDLESLIRAIVRDEIAKAVANDEHSRRPSDEGNGAPGQGDQECSREFMDRTNTETDGASTSSPLTSEEQGREFIRALQRGTPPRRLPTERATKRKATR